MHPLAPTLLGDQRLGSEPFMRVIQVAPSLAISVAALACGGSPTRQGAARANDSVDVAAYACSSTKGGLIKSFTLSLSSDHSIAKITGTGLFGDSVDISGNQDSSVQGADPRDTAYTGFSGQIEGESPTLFVSSDLVSGAASGTVTLQLVGDGSLTVDYSCTGSSNSTAPDAGSSKGDY
jgi:hypothetical protein